MTVWHNLLILSRKHLPVHRLIFGFLIVIALSLAFSIQADAAPGINKTLSFQGRLLNKNGSVVADGYYNMQFKIYEGGSGTVKNNTDGSLDWHEEFINNNSNGGVLVKNGYFSVALGSRNPFGSSVDWNQDTLWLSMNVAGSNNNCTDFDDGVCVADGEMLPMKRISSVPTAINSSLLGGKSADTFVQIGQGIQNDATDLTSIAINKTGSGNFLDFQKNSQSILSITNSGSVLLGNDSDKTISIAKSSADENGKNLSLISGDGGDGTGSNGGNIIIAAGGAGGTDGDGGNIYIDAGAGSGNGIAGTIAIGTTSPSRINLGADAGGSQIALNGTTTITGDSSSEFSVADSLNSKVLVVDTLSSRVGIGQDAKADYTLDVSGDVNTSSQYRIDGEIALTNSSLTFSGSETSIVSASGGQSLELNSDEDVSVNVDSHNSITISKTSIKIGDNASTGTVTLLTLDSSASAPGSALPGSMYYNTTLGKIQCYQADGWGNCSDTPDTFVSLAPEFAGSVVNGLGDGDMTTGFCSNDLGINDGSPGQSAICNTDGETYNYYNWTTNQATEQTRSIYVSYQLPSNFKEFVAGSTSLMNLTDSSDASISYQIYRNSSVFGLTSCGSKIDGSTGAKTEWQETFATGLNDPANCGFEPGDGIVIKINLSSNNDANAYVSNLRFTMNND